MGSIRKFLAMNKKIAKLCEIRGLRVKTNNLLNPLCVGIIRIFKNIWMIWQKTACKLVE